MPTIQQVMDNVMIAVNDRDHYVFGGTSLYSGADCSGLLYRSLINVGVGNPPRTSQAQFAAWQPAPGPGYGIAVFFDVPQDGPPQPQHVGICVTATTFAEEPHTGLDAEIVPIPNIPGVESIMGYRYLPVSYGPAPAPPTPTPPPPPPIIATLGEEMAEGPTVIESANDGNRHVFQTLGEPGSETTWHWWQDMKGQPSWAWNCEPLTAAKT